MRSQRWHVQPEWVQALAERKIITIVACFLLDGYLLFCSRFLRVAQTCGRPRGLAHCCSPWTAPADLSETNRRLSQYPAPAKKTAVTCRINRGLWSGRGPAALKGPAACGDRGCGPGKYDDLFTLGLNAFDLFRTNRMCQSRMAEQRCRRKGTGQPDIQRWLLIQRRVDTGWSAELRSGRGCCRTKQGWTLKHAESWAMLEFSSFREPIMEFDIGRGQFCC